MKAFITKLLVTCFLLTAWQTVAPVVTLGANPAPAPVPVAVQPMTQNGAGTSAGLSGHATGTVLGVTWKRGTAHGAPLVSVRYRVGGVWSAWTALEMADQPDQQEIGAARRPGSPVQRDGTEPLVTLGMTDYEARVSSAKGLPRDLKVVTVDASATTSLVNTPPASAAAEGTRPAINSRASWGADESKRDCTPTYMSSIKAIGVHHTAGTNSYTPEQVPSIINGIYNYHTGANGWCDIGYNALVDRFGRLWEGRHGGLDRNVRPAAQGGFNQYTGSISAIGDFDTVSAPSGMVEAISRFLSWRLGLAHVDPLGSTSLTTDEGSTKYPAGSVVRVGTVFGHRNTSLTSCPGTNLYAVLATIRARARSLAGSAAIFGPSINSTRMTTTDLPAFRINATTPSWQSVDLSVKNDRGTEVYRSAGATLLKRFSAVWDKRDANGSPVAAGTYTLTVSSSSTSARALPLTMTVQVTGAAAPLGDPPPLHFVNRTPGSLYTTTHEWRTTCAPYSSATRCQVMILSAGVWKQNNWAYLDQGNAAWARNHLAYPGLWSSAGRALSTSCSPSSSTGPRVCRTNFWSASSASWVIDSFVWLGDGR